MRVSFDSYCGVNSRISGVTTDEGIFRGFSIILNDRGMDGRVRVIEKIVIPSFPDRPQAKRKYLIPVD